MLHQICNNVLITALTNWLTFSLQKLSLFCHLQSFAPIKFVSLEWPPNHCLPFGVYNYRKELIQLVFLVPVTQVRQADDYQRDITVKILTKMLSSSPQKPSLQDTLVQSILQLSEQLIWAVDQPRAQMQTIQNWLHAETTSVWSDLLAQITS